MEEYKFEVIQDGIAVASSTARDRDDAMREIMHYASVYAKDGKVLIRETISRRRKR